MKRDGQDKIYNPGGMYVQRESDSSGMDERGAVFLCLFSDNQGACEIPYPSITGMNRDENDIDTTWLKINFEAEIDWDKTATLARYQAQISGRRLESMIREIRVARRTTIRVTGDVEKGEQVDSIIITMRDV